NPAQGLRHRWHARRMHRAHRGVSSRRLHAHPARDLGRRPHRSGQAFRRSRASPLPEMSAAVILSVAGVDFIQELWSFFMRLITFENPTGAQRIGALTLDGKIVDLTAASALYLKEKEHEPAFERLANALVPPDMRALFEGGDTSLEAARQ